MIYTYTHARTQTAEEGELLFFILHFSSSSYFQIMYLEFYCFCFVSFLEALLDA